MAQDDNGRETWVQPESTAEVQTQSEGGPRYVEERVLGTGALGQVVLVRDGDLGRDVAVKTLLPGRGARARNRFLREARITAQLEHPAIVPVHEVGTDEAGQPFYTMQYVRGRAMSEALEDAPGLDARLELVPAFSACCQALAYAHSRGVIHRDLKPANLMLGGYGEAIVVDWGLARFIDEAMQTDEGPLVLGETAATQDGAIAGTPAYMAPEAARGEPVGPASDVYSLGAVLYEILTGVPPHGSDGLENVLRRARLAEFRPLAEVVPDAPGELIAIATKALSPSEEDRYPDARGLAEDVGAWLAGLPVHAYQYSPTERAVRFFLRYRLVTGAVAVSVVAIIAILALTTVLVSSERDRALQSESLALQSRDDAERALAASLADRARLASDVEDRLSARILAAEALIHHENPLARGLLARFWDEPVPELLQTMQAPHGCRGVALLDDTSVLCAGSDRISRLDLLAGRVDWTRDVPGVRRVTVDPEGTRIGIDGFDGAAVLDPDGETLEVLVKGDLSVVELGPDGSVAWSVNNAVRYRNDAGEHSLVYPSRVAGILFDGGPPVTLAQSGAIYDGGRFQVAIATSSLGIAGSRDRLFVAARALHRVEGTENTRHPASGMLVNIAAGPQVVLAGSADQAAYAWDIESGVLLARLPDHGAPVAGVAVRGDRWVTAGGRGEIRVWQAPMVRHPQKFVPWDAGGPMASGTDGTVYACGRSGELVAFPPRRERPRRLDVLGSGGWAPAASSERQPPDVKRSAWGCQAAGGVPYMLVEPGEVYRVKDGVKEQVEVPLVRRLAVLDDGTAVGRVFRGSEVLDFQLLPDGPLLPGDQVVGSAGRRLLLQDDGALVLVSVDDEVVRELWRRDGVPDARAASADLSRIARAARDGTVIVEDAETGAGALRLAGHVAPATAALFLSPGRLATGSWDDSVRVWDLATGTELATLTGHSGRISGLAYDGERFLYSGSFDNTYRAWDLSVLDEPAERLTSLLQQQTGLAVEEGRVRFIGRPPVTPR